MTERWRGQGQYCPIARAAELLGERWTLLILRDILVGTSHFNDLARGLPGLSRSLLTKRLRALEHAEVIEHLDGRYLLTESGEALRPIVFALGEWGCRAQREGRVRFDGTAAITRRMPNLLQLSPAAEMVRASATTR
jgi:DNA-binding HxlR family transcriptional regulator